MITHVDNLPCVNIDEARVWTRHIPCPHAHDGKCTRCAEGRTGYTFRWYSVLWGEGYQRMRAPYTWDPTADVPGLDGMDDDKRSTFTGNVMSSHGVITEASRNRPQLVFVEQ